MHKSMKVYALATFAAFGGLVSAQATAQITMSWSYVGDPANPPDPDTGSVYGSVDHGYNIGTYDVTVSQYVAFLNSNDPTGADPLGLYNDNMSSARYGGIDANPGAASGSKYSVISGDGNHPENWVSWFDAIRFANWLNNGQVPGSTETGAYTLGPLGPNGIPIDNGDLITRNSGATVFLPSENEWYKAAYYNPATGTYYQYPTSSNTFPTATGPTSTPNSANYNNAVGSLTDVAAYTGTASPYGAFDMAGNLWNWSETLIASPYFRGIRGGEFDDNSAPLLSSYRVSTDPGGVGYGIGFRVASIPEPSSIAAPVHRSHRLGLSSEAQATLMLTTVPEPGGITLAGLGLLVLVVRWRAACNPSPAGQTWDQETAW